LTALIPLPDINTVDSLKTARDRSGSSVSVRMRVASQRRYRTVQRTTSFNGC